MSDFSEWITHPQTKEAKKALLGLIDAEKNLFSNSFIASDPFTTHSQMAAKVSRINTLQEVIEEIFTIGK